MVKQNQKNIMKTKGCKNKNEIVTEIFLKKKKKYKKEYNEEIDVRICREKINNS